MISNFERGLYMYKKTKFSVFVSMCFITAFIVSQPTHAEPKKKVERGLFYAKKASEAKMEFKFYVEIPSTSCQASRAPSQDTIDEALEAQLVHLFGPMARFGSKGVPKGGETTVILDKVCKDNIWQVAYSYAGTILVEKSATSNNYAVWLPFEPSSIFRVSKSSDGINRCTDGHYQTEGDFWYFWFPDRVGCPIKNRGMDFNLSKYKPGVFHDHGKSLFARIPITELEKKENTKKTYPEYDHLADDNGTVLISVNMGMDNPNESNHDPMSSEGTKDINAYNYEDIYNTLLNDFGFKDEKQWNDLDIFKIVPRLPDLTVPYVKDLVRTYDNPKTNIKKIIVRHFFGPSGINESSEAFHYFYKDAIENASTMIYDGHSGLGGHLDLAAIERMHKFKIRSNPKKYQIYFFNSCTSYRYYNTMYFKPKRTLVDGVGTAKLDIINNGLETAFNAIPQGTSKLVEAIHQFATLKVPTTYQDIADTTDSDNLLAINGDEDESNSEIPGMRPEHR